jgi:hypothetical protein
MVPRVERASFPLHFGHGLASFPARVVTGPANFALGLHDFALRFLTSLPDFPRRLRAFPNHLGPFAGHFGAPVSAAILVPPTGSGKNRGECQQCDQGKFH